MNISDVFSAVVDFFTFGYSLGKVDEEENRRQAKLNVEASDEGKMINELKEALDEVKHLRTESKPEPVDAANASNPASVNRNQSARIR
jgi:hypothetical protein